MLIEGARCKKIRTLLIPEQKVAQEASSLSASVGLPSPPGPSSPHIHSHTHPSMKGKVHERALRSTAWALLLHTDLDTWRAGRNLKPPLPQPHRESSPEGFANLHASESSGELVKTYIAVPHPKSFSRSGQGQENVHFQQVPR